MIRLKESDGEFAGINFKAQELIGNNMEEYHAKRTSFYGTVGTGPLTIYITTFQCIAQLNDPVSTWSDDAPVVVYRWVDLEVEVI